MLFCFVPTFLLGFVQGVPLPTTWGADNGVKVYQNGVLQVTVTTSQGWWNAQGANLQNNKRIVLVCQNLIC